MNEETDERRKFEIYIESVGQQALEDRPQDPLREVPEQEKS